MKKVYVVSRYAGDVQANVKAAVNFCRKVIDAGYMPIASHLLYPQMLDDSNPAQRSLGLTFGLELLKLCDEVWVFGSVSLGMLIEIEEAKQLNKKIVYFEEIKNVAL